MTTRQDQIYEVIDKHKYYKVLRGSRKLRFDEFLKIADHLTGYLPKFLEHFIGEDAVGPVYANQTDSVMPPLNKDTLLILSVLELSSYKKLSKHSDQLIAKKVGLDVHEVKSKLEKLLALKVIEKNKNNLYQALDTSLLTINSKKESERIHNIWREEIYNTAILEKSNNRLTGTHAFFMSSKSLDEKIVELNNRFYNDLRLLIQEFDKKPQGPTHVRVLSINYLDLIDDRQ